jgi:hypothetical protein
MRLQHLSYLKMTPPSGVVYRCPVRQVTFTSLSSRLDQNLHYILMALDGGDIQRCPKVDCLMEIDKRIVSQK